MSRELSALRSASRTSGALGSVTDREMKRVGRAASRSDGSGVSAPTRAVNRAKKRESSRGKSKRY